jgi:hypothetical protein
MMFWTWVLKLGPEPDHQSGWGTGLGHYWSVLGFFYLLFFIVAFLLAWASVIVPRVNASLPQWAHPLWPWRSAIVGGVTLLALMFLLLELLAGFGLEHAQEKDASYVVRSTGALGLVVFVMLCAIVGAALEFWLVLRKSRPLPRIDISW